MRIIIEIDPQQLQASAQQQGSSGPGSPPGFGSGGVPTGGSGASFGQFGGGQDAGAAPSLGGGGTVSTGAPMLPFSYTSPPDTSSYGGMGSGSGDRMGSGMSSTGSSGTGMGQSAGAAPGTSMEGPTAQTRSMENDE